MKSLAKFAILIASLLIVEGCDNSGKVALAKNPSLTGDDELGRSIKFGAVNLTGVSFNGTAHLKIDYETTELGKKDGDFVCGSSSVGTPTNVNCRTTASKEIDVPLGPIAPGKNQFVEQKISVQDPPKQCFALEPYPCNGTIVITLPTSAGTQSQTISFTTVGGKGKVTKVS